MNEVFEQWGVKTVFDGSSCFPAYTEFNGRRDIFRTRLSMVLEDGREYAPILGSHDDVLRYKVDFGERIEFFNLTWASADGRPGDSFKLSLRYEFDNSGAVFVNAFFHSENLNAPAIRLFRLSHTLNLRDFREVRWESFPRPSTTNPTEMMLTFPERNISRGESRDYPGQLLSKVGFTCWGSHSDSVYFEFFLQGGGVLDCRNSDKAASRILWDAVGCVQVQWDFLSQETKLTNQLWQWRNQWGWVVIKPRAERTKPPLRMYHFFDAIRRYPSDRQLEKMARNGADIVVMHEGWRSDVQNNCYPADAGELRRSIGTAHRLGLRVALYTRGSEQSVAQEYAPWFDAWLKRDWDGLYMDYGGAFNETNPPSEWYPNGEFLFRRYIERIHHLRQRVGDGGVLFSHTGSTFSALGQSPDMLDLYVSGEAEAGAMIRSRENHDYYANSMCGPGSMWTAAFPEYGTEKMLPFLAVAGQTPHAPIGVQFESSSLMHSTEPGMEDRYLRPLWKLWGLFKHQGKIRFYNHLNSPLQSSSLMISEAADAALLIIANFSGEAATVSESLDWRTFGLSPQRLVLLRPTCVTPGTPEELPVTPCAQSFAVPLPAYGVAGVLINGQCLADELVEYTRAYPADDDADREYYAAIEEQRRLRQNGAANFQKCYLRVSIPPISFSFEDSLILDLYDNVHEFGVIEKDGSFRSIGWAAKDGLVSQRPTHHNYIYLGERSVWYDVTEYKGHQLAMRTFHGNGDTPFYSFVLLELSDEPARNTRSYDIRFVNELEPDRAWLHFSL